MVKVCNISCNSVGFLFFALGHLLILAITVSYFTVFFPRIFGEISSLSVFITGIGLFILMNVLVHYCKTTFVDPGSPQSLLVNIDKTYAVENRMFCSLCDYYKPPNAHHCSACQKCVLQMDHHCIWVNNCIGQNNIGHFYRFLVWLTLGALFICILLAPHAWSTFRSHPSLYSVKDFCTQLIVMTWSLCTAVTIAMTVLGVLQFELWARGASKIDYLKGVVKARGFWNTLCRYIKGRKKLRV